MNTPIEEELEEPTEEDLDRYEDIIEENKDIADAWWDEDDWESEMSGATYLEGTNFER